MDQYDIVVIGAGVVGCAIARYLSRYKVRILVVEKEEDVCSGTSKANSGIVHAGFDAVPGTLMAKMNVKGCSMMKDLSTKLDFHYKNNGSLVLCFNDNDMPLLENLYKRGIQNGVQGLKILSKQEAKYKEPAISDEVVSTLWAPSAGIVCPFSLTIAFAENAATNGVSFLFDEEVKEIRKTEEFFTVKTENELIKTSIVINAAGVYADRFHNMVSKTKIKISPRKGEYILMDKEIGDFVESTIFQLPGKFGKGVLVTPTVHGNLLVGPTAIDIEDKENTETTYDGMGDVRQRALKSVPDIPYGKMITNFAGLRAHEDKGDFIIGEVDDCKGFFDVAGIESPGLTCAPAIGEYISDLIANRYGFIENVNFSPYRKGFVEVTRLSLGEKNKLIKARPEYGNIVCRCENISEGEIIDAIHRVPGARSMDGVKRRVRQGMGRCQGGFCTPKTMEILSRELKIEMTRITKNKRGSELLSGCSQIS